MHGAAWLGIPENCFTRMVALLVVRSPSSSTIMFKAGWFMQAKSEKGSPLQTQDSLFPWIISSLFGMIVSFVQASAFKVWLFTLIGGQVSTFSHTAQQEQEGSASQ